MNLPEDSNIQCILNEAEDYPFYDAEFILSQFNFANINDKSDEDEEEEEEEEEEEDNDDEATELDQLSLFDKSAKQLAIICEYYGLLNTDVWVPKNWLKPLLKSFDTYPDAAIIQPHILNQKKPNYFEYAGAAGGYIDKYGVTFCRGRIINKLEEDLGQYDKNEEIFWASGACFLIRSKIF